MPAQSLTVNFRGSSFPFCRNHLLLEAFFLGTLFIFRSVLITVCDSFSVYQCVWWAVAPGG